MAAPAWCEDIREAVERSLCSYRLRPVRAGGFKVIRLCQTGESHIGFFVYEWPAVEFLRGRMLQAERR